MGELAQQEEIDDSVASRGKTAAPDDEMRMRIRLAGQDVHLALFEGLASGLRRHVPWIVGAVSAVVGGAVAAFSLFILGASAWTTGIGVASGVSIWVFHKLGREGQP